MGSGEAGPTVVKETINSRYQVLVDFTFREVLNTHPWNFNTAEECLQRMHESEKVVTDCPLWGSPFCSLEPQHPKVAVPHRV